MHQAQTISLARARSEQYSDAASLRHVVLEHYDREHLPLRRYLAFLGLDGDMSQEIVQDTFLKLHQHLLAGGDGTQLRAWLYRVAHNLARNVQLSAVRRRSGSLSDDPRSGEIKADSASAEDELIARERLSRMRSALAQLNPAQKECLVLRSQGLKYREIAEVLNLAVSTVAENIQRGLANLKGVV